MNRDRHYLQEALKEAEKRRGFCAPNPSVGAVVVCDNQIISRGNHWAAGSAHAEVVALQHIGGKAVNATLYVTLEPCCHVGKTPACTDFIIQAGIKRVIFAVMDPNPLVSGNGMRALKIAGIDCEQVNVAEVTEFYRSYVYWMEHQCPFVTLKLAVSADDKFSGERGKPLSITGEACRQLTHQWRQRSDAILTTVKTILADDPQFNVRLSDNIVAKPVAILDSDLKLPLNAQIFKTASQVTVYHRHDADHKRMEILKAKNVRCVSVDADLNGLDLRVVLDDIGQQGVHDVWVEVGAHCFRSFYQAQLAQRIFIYRSKKRLGENAQAAFSDTFNPLHNRKLTWQCVGEDEVCELHLN